MESTQLPSQFPETELAGVSAHSLAFGADVKSNF
jgi:hypothetical protein